MCPWLGHRALNVVTKETTASSEPAVSAENLISGDAFATMVSIRRRTKAPDTGWRLIETPDVAQTLSTNRANHTLT